MPRVETYLGKPEKNPETGQWELKFDQHFQMNLDSICELARTIFDAHYCVINTNIEGNVISLSTCGESLVTQKSQRSSVGIPTQFNELILPAKLDDKANVNDALPTVSQIHSPIVLPSGLLFGTLIFERKSNDPFDDREKAILSVLQRDINNHLLQQKHTSDIVRTMELQELVSRHNQDFIFVKDEDFRILYANDAFLTLFPEAMRDKVIGFTMVEEFEEDEAAIFLAQDKIAFEKGISVVTENIHSPNGDHIIIETVKRRFEDEHGKPHILGVCRDITEREGLIRDLKKANSELDDFASIASHDLKSPLNAIKRLLEWVEEDCKALLPEEHLENLQLVINRADRMKVLLDDLLGYAKIDPNDTSKKNINLNDLHNDLETLLDVPASMDITIEKANLTVPVVPFKTVMLNLIGNAIKHNDKEQGVVNVSLVPSRHYYIIEVTDNGPGIEEKYFDRIFQIFQTLRSRDEVEGSGMGLSVVLKHLNNFGGKIEVESDGKLGTTFRVYWPRKRN